MSGQERGGEGAGLCFGLGSKGKGGKLGDVRGGQLDPKPPSMALLPPHKMLQFLPKRHPYLFADLHIGWIRMQAAA